MSIKVTLLCEDKQTESFARRFLFHRGFDHRDILALPLPHGKQSGEQWVRCQYPRQLKAIRSRRGVLLVVIADADSLTVKARKDELNQECKKQEVQVRTSKDPVIMAIPRRNIETWFAYLDGTEVDEKTTYPRLNRIGDCHKHAKVLYQMCHERQELAEPAPPALREACEEYRKLKR